MHKSLKYILFFVSFLTCLVRASTMYAESQYNASCILQRYDGNEENVRIPSFINDLSITIIGERCFAGNESIRTVIIPDTIEEIGCYAFTATDIESIAFEGDYLKSIRDGAFSLTSIYEIVLPESVDSLGSALFMSCFSLDCIELPEIMYTLPTYMFFECVSLTDITLPDSIELIGNYAFYGCTELKTVVWPANLLTIEESAFESCGFERIELPSEIQFIHANAFACCESLTYCSLPQSLLYIDKSAFDGCSSDLVLGVIKDSVGYHFAVENAIPYQIIDMN